MPISINGSGTLSGLTPGGLPDASITAPDLSGGQSGSAPIYGCRAWVNFDGTRNEADTGASTNGANVKIRASGNVTSVLKNGTGDYTVNFTTALADGFYAACVNSGNSAGGGQGAWTTAFSVAATTAASLRIGGYSSAGVALDQDQVMIAIFR